ncbi:MAG TPA: cell division protein FtsX, partial [Prolixibacteraceae bacterium]|nr:cell division protein FtsX [Prolixibacteraceae bacterium]
YTDRRMVLLINAIRLSVYSKRFIINTMQLVGATRGFIRKPFVSSGVLHGLFGGLIANFFLILVIINYNKHFHEIINYSMPDLLAVVFVIVVITGISLSWISTTLAVNKFLRLRYDELFY